MINILLVEDNPADVDPVKEAFEEGRLLCRLHVAEDGEAALQFLKKQGPFADTTRPELILLDLNLPKKDGREVLEEIKRDPDLQSIPVIVLTTSDDEADVLRAYGLHANCYLTKPVSLLDFVRKVRSIDDFWFGVVRLPVDRAIASPLGSSM